MNKEQILKKIEKLDIYEIVKTALMHYQYCEFDGICELNTKNWKIQGYGYNPNSYLKDNNIIEIFKIDRFTDFNCYEYWIKEQEAGHCCENCGRAMECTSDCEGYRKYPSKEIIIRELTESECLDWDMIHENINDFLERNFN